MGAQKHFTKKTPNCVCQWWLQKGCIVLELTYSSPVIDKRDQAAFLSLFISFLKPTANKTEHCSGPAVALCPFSLTCEGNSEMWLVSHYFHWHSHGSTTTATHGLGSSSAVIKRKHLYLRINVLLSALALIVLIHCSNQQLTSLKERTARVQKIG